MKEVKSVIVGNPSRHIKEAFKSELPKEFKLSFEKDLGEPHPFSYQQAEKIYKKFGLVKTAVDKHVDFIISPGFYVESEDDRAKTIINKFIQEKNFEQILRKFILETLVKGSGFMEITENNNSVDLKVVNPNYMFINRNQKGEIEGYTQYFGDDSKLEKDKKIPFSVEEIVHLPFNQIGDCPYGIGYVYPAMYTLDNMCKGDKDMHMMLMRKANSPFIINTGTPEEPATQGEVDALTAKLEWLRNYHEWVFDHKTTASVLDFGSIGDKFLSILEYDKDMLFYIFQIPSVLMGTDNVPEGLANVQMDAFNRHIQSLQSAAEKVIEEQIFKRILKMNGIDAHVELEWGQPSNDEINKRLEKLTTLLSNSQLSPELRAMLEIEIAQILQFSEKDIATLVEPIDARQMKEEEMERQMNMQMQNPFNKSQNPERKKEETKIKQPEVPGQKPAQKEMLEFIKKEGNKYCVYSHQTGKSFGCYKSRAEAKKRLEQMHQFNSFKPKENWDWKNQDMTLKEFVNLQEMRGFNFKQYLKNILKAIKVDEFTDLKAVDLKEIDEGKLSEEQVEKLRKILHNGFEKNQTIKEIETEIDKLELKDRTREGKIVVASNLRPNMISRTETVRLANEGLVKTFEQNQVEQVRWLAALSDRTCPQCEALNGRIFNLNEMAVGTNQPPLHVACRCSLLPVFND